MTVASEMEKLREISNAPIFIYNLKRHGFLWDMVCASMDMIGDSQLAIDAFGGSTTDDGQAYLEIYGLFQAMFLQQDALVNLTAGLKLGNLRVFDDPDMGRVRELRNKYFGHPTKRDRPGPTTYHGLTRMTVTTAEITGWTYPVFATETIRVANIVKQQEQGAIRILQKLIRGLEAKMEAYMAKFDGKALPINDHGYEFQKLYGWAIDPGGNDAMMADVSLDYLEQTVDKIDTGVKERYEDADGFGGITRMIEKVQFCIAHTRAAMSSSPESGFEREVYLDSLEQTYKNIVEICKEINASFSADVN